MDQERSTSATIPVSSIIVIGGLIAAVTMYEPPLSSARPDGTTGIEASADQVEDVHARLWQDPFSAAIQHREGRVADSSSDHAHQIESVNADARELIADHELESLDTVLTIAMMVPVSPYAEDTETRRRRRVAVIEALADHALIPNAPDSIGYIEGATNCNGEIPLTPFEWFVRETPRDTGTDAVDAVGYGVVLVLWIAEDHFVSKGTNPLAAVESLTGQLLVSTLRYPWDSAPNGTSKPVPIAVVGPSSSGTLEVMSGERCPPNAPPAHGHETRVAPEQLAKTLLDSVHQYLDNGIPKRTPEIEAEVAAAIGLLQEDLADESISRLKRSLIDLLEVVEEADEDWSDTTVDTFINEHADDLVSYEDIARFARTSAAYVVLQTNSYLDNDIPQQVDRNHLREVLGNVITSSVDTRNIEEIRSAIESTLTHELGDITDADPSWASTMATRYINAVKNRFSFTSPGSDVQSLKVYSAFATVADPLFERTNLADEDLAKGLASELDRRHLDDEDAVLLVGEWDTRYGRALLQTFASALAATIPKLDVHEVRYLRGLDGAVPAAEASLDRGSSAKDEHDKSFTQNVRELVDEMKRLAPSASSSLNPLDRLTQQTDELRAVGTQRFDYMSRLAAELGDKRIRAVGVLGSDPYDKQIAIQTLQPRFPDAIFFTTDLDARLYEKGAVQWTRNLVVASGRGLQPIDQDSESNDRLDLSFRDSYQTDAYQAVSQALGSRFVRLVDACLFEITRDGVVPLNAPAQCPRPESASNAFYVSVVLAGIGMLLLIYFLIPAVHDWVSPPGASSEAAERIRKKERAATGYLVLVAVVGFAIFAILIVQNMTPEPFAWASGASAWPTEILRWVAIVVALGLIFRCFARLEFADLAMERFGLSKPVPVPTPEAKVHIRHFSREPDADEAPAPTEDPLDIWREFQGYATRHARLLRTILLTLSAVLFAGGLAFWLGWEPAPVSGDIALWIDWTLTIGAWGCVAFLTFLVYDASHLCEAWVSRFGRTRLVWPARVIEEAKTRLGLTHRNDVAEVLTIEAIGLRTQEIGRFVTYPFIVLALLLLARNAYFDNWIWPDALIIAFVVLATFALVPAFSVRQVARRARDNVRTRLQPDEASAYGQGDRDGELRAMEIKTVIEMIDDTEFGAFAPWRRHPILKALLIPFGGIGAVTALQLAGAFGL